MKIYIALAGFFGRSLFYKCALRCSAAALLLAVPLSANANSLYVDLNCTNSTPPFTNWITAATNIQDAVDVAVAGDEVVVTNGIYSIGGRAVDGLMTNRVVVDKPLTLRSLNGPEVTVIQGQFAPGTNNGDGAIRCVYLTNGASLYGFTLTNGATRLAGDFGKERSGGGVWCASTSEVVSNCVLAGNSAWNGGGAYFGTLTNCILTLNSVVALGGGACYANLNNCMIRSNSSLNHGGGAYSGVLSNCTLTGNSVGHGSVNGRGGGANSSILNNCTLTGNSAIFEGGGVWSGTCNGCTISSNSCGFNGGGDYSSILNNCRLTRNSAANAGGGSDSGLFTNCTLTANSANYGGGVSGGTLYNCTLTGNWATNQGGGVYGGTIYNCSLSGNSASVSSGGVFAATVNNCVVYYNSAPDGNCGPYSTVNYCCTTPLPTNGLGNVTSPPLYVNTNDWSNLRLQATSPCINSGNNDYASAGSDLDGNPRISGGTVDIGAYEYQSPPSIISYAWLQQYGLPTDGSADHTDADNDGMNNWQEWICGTNPTNALSLLTILSATNTAAGTIINWRSVTNRTYSLECSTNLRTQPAFFPIQSNIVGQAGTTSFTDTNATGPGPFLYRVGVVGP